MHAWLAGLIVFGTSAAVLVLEILAVRLLAPFLGVTLEVTTGVIGVILAGIALGTWLGGRAADSMDPRKLLGPILIAGGVLALLVIPIVSLVAASDLDSSPQGILVATTAAFFLPAAVLGGALIAAVVGGAGYSAYGFFTESAAAGRFETQATRAAHVNRFLVGELLGGVTTGDEDVKASELLDRAADDRRPAEGCLAVDRGVGEVRAAIEGGAGEVRVAVDGGVAEGCVALERGASEITVAQAYTREDQTR